MIKDRYIKLGIVFSFVVVGIFGLFREDINSSYSGFLGICFGLMLIQSLVIFDYEVKLEYINLRLKNVVKRLK